MSFDEFYVHWYSRMKNFAREYVMKEDDAEDIVQDIFLELYEKYNVLPDKANIVAYVFTAIKNRCIDLLRRKIVEQESANRMQEEYLLTLRMKFDSLDVLENRLFNENNVEDILRKALDTLPKRCREIFIKHKVEGKKRGDIATELDLSLKTVENQLTIAYRKIRFELKDYEFLLLLLGICV